MPVLDPRLEGQSLDGWPWPERCRSGQRSASPCPRPGPPPVGEAAVQEEAEKADLAEEIATLKAEIAALEEELAKMDAAAATPAEPDR